MEPPNRQSISAIVPTLNEAGCIAACLSSLRNQDEALTQIILVDGGSTDATLENVRDLADEVITATPGRAAQMNAGAQIARGNILWFIHADTLVPPGASRAVRTAVAAGALWGRFDIRLKNSRFVFRIIERAINLRSCLSGIATGDQGLFVRRVYFDKVKAFPAIALMEDVALSRLLKAHARPACVKPALLASARRWEQQGVAPTIWLMWRLRYAYWRGADPAQLRQRYTLSSRS